MAQTAAHLVDRVLPPVGLRQWVLTLPFPLRYRLAWDTALCAAVLRTFLRVVFGFYQQQATALGLPGGRTGAVTVIESFGSTLNLNVHFHALVLDGVYVWDNDRDTPIFHPIPPPRTSEVQQLVDTIRAFAGHRPTADAARQTL